MPRRTIAAIAAALAITAALAGCSTTSGSTTASSSAAASSATGTTLTLATDASYPPCESYTTTSGTKTMVGFEPDIWNAIAAKTGQKLNVVNTGFDSLIPGVQSGKFNLTMECISDNATREAQVTFLDFILAKDAVITTAHYSGPISSTDPLSVCGQTMGAQAGFDVLAVVKDTVNPACVKAGKKAVTIQSYPSAAASYNALYSGRVDFIIQDTAAATILNQTSPVKLKTFQNSLLPQFYLGIVFNKKDTANLAAWQKGLDQIVADGTYAAVLKKWGLSDLALTPGVNLATTKPIAG